MREDSPFVIGPHRQYGAFAADGRMRTGRGGYATVGVAFYHAQHPGERKASKCIFYVERASRANCKVPGLKRRRGRSSIPMNVLLADIGAPGFEPATSCARIKPLAAEPQSRRYAAG